MKPTRMVAIVVGCLLLVPGVAMVLGGGALGLGYLFSADGDGYLVARPDRVSTRTVALTAEDLTLGTDPGSPDRLVDALDLDVRLQATNTAADRPLFLGIARQSDVDAYLAGVAHDELADVQDDGTPTYRSRRGSDEVAPPGAQTFWAASTEGTGTQQLDWQATSGRWAAVLMEADGSPGVAADVEVGARPGFVVPTAAILVVGGVALVAGAVALLLVGAQSDEDERHGRGRDLTATAPGPVASGAAPRSPVALEAHLDPHLSRWQWLVKWLLAIPHYVVLAFLWVAFVVLTAVAGVTILVTGRYPRGIFDFNVGVLRWTWRVSHYASTGGLGTDAYPPFRLHAGADDPARLEVAYPAQLSRGLVLVKWWLLALPQYLVVALLVGGGAVWDQGLAAGLGLLGVLTLVAGVTLLVTGRYPRPLFDLIVGLDRWVYRVIAYAALMTDEYPPFRLDQGGSEPDHSGPPRPPGGSGVADDGSDPTPSGRGEPDDRAGASASAQDPRPVATGSTA